MMLRFVAAPAITTIALIAKIGTVAALVTERPDFLNQRLVRHERHKHRERHTLVCQQQRRRRRRQRRRQPLHLQQEDRGDQDAPVLVRDELGCSPTLSVLANIVSNLSKILSSPTTMTTTATTTSTNTTPVSLSLSSSSPTFFFDPLQLACDDNFARYREAELKHGRVACLAVVACVGVTYSQDDQVKRILSDVWTEWVASSAFFQSNDNDDMTTATVSSAESTDVVTRSDLPLLQQLREKLPLPAPLHLLQDWTLGDFVRMILVCGIMETLVWVQTDPQALPGDYGTGYFGVRDKGLHERSLLAELENCRLCMMIMLYYLVVGDFWTYYLDYVDVGGVS